MTEPLFCVNCAYASGQSEGTVCQHPETVNWNLVTGDADYPKASDARAEGSKCGPAGLLFEWEISEPIAAGTAFEESTQAASGPIKPPVGEAEDEEEQETETKKKGKKH